MAANTLTRSIDLDDQDESENLGPLTKTTNGDQGNVKPTFSNRRGFNKVARVWSMTTTVQMKDTEKQSSRLESKTNTELNNGDDYREWKIT
jgi:hypothetical protein